MLNYHRFVSYGLNLPDHLFLCQTVTIISCRVIKWRKIALRQAYAGLQPFNFGEGRPRFINISSDS
jgi:hypothetical protein